MVTTRRAVIDVGTNSVKLLVADVAGREVRPVWERSKQTRLGQGFYEGHRLQPEPIAATAAAVATFAAKAREQQAVSVRVIATSAAREAVNGPDLVAATERVSGLKVEIISGEQEADWAFRGVTSDPRLAQVPALVLEVGGGSTQLILGQGDATRFRQSLQLGTVRLMEQLARSDPPTPAELTICRQRLKELLQAEVQPGLGPTLQQERASRPGPGEVQLVGVGGTASILGCMEAELDAFDRQRLEATRLTLDRVHWHVARLWSLPLEKRQQIIGLPPKRADVILSGVAIYEAVMEQFDFPVLRISTRGLRFAAVMDAV
jgi:exopolyphosphatase / guanosine-5'-triphosphate,3'-diphosphate pyrophosphatase